MIKKLKTPRAKTRKTKKTIVVTEWPEIRVQRAVVYLNYCQWLSGVSCTGIGMSLELIVSDST